MGENVRTKFGGMDVHQKSISTAIADAGPELHFVYEAGPCGFALYRHFTGNGFCCIGSSPSIIPKKSGVRINYVPDAEDEAMRGLIRKKHHP
ncbi:MAG: hypothetical protein GY702_16915 [Desulfobulbaceae bacterium]|nr:hypothetical protein [Desulfobulbaceae bacterium]